MDEKNELQEEQVEAKDENIEVVSKEIKEDEESKEEVVEQDEMEELETALEEESENISEEKNSFFKTFQATIIDQLIVGAVSVVAVYLLDFILKLAGYHIVKMVDMGVILFVIITIFYSSIMESSKNRATVGKKVSNLFVARGTK